MAVNCSFSFATFYLNFTYLFIHADRVGRAELSRRVNSIGAEEEELFVFSVIKKKKKSKEKAAVFEDWLVACVVYQWNVCMTSDYP